MIKTIKATEIYTRKYCCEELGWRENDKRQFEYLRYIKGAKFVLGPAPHRKPWQEKYYITGIELYKFIKSWRPNFISLIKFENA